ncbi:MAG: M81 family metallopeptidase [Proteobacteria bacterium]|nr:M81 family metallopeptidase [Pseudomonadota bacterium]MBI3499280.1 M81 family metallopeptidase [Pseudomonadota bacterium]
MAPRVLVGGTWHETNSFSPIRTDLSAFHRYLYLEGDAVISGSSGTNTEIGGMIDGAEANGIELLPTVFAGAAPSGMVDPAVLEQVIERICRGVDEFGRIDGVLLTVHGAMVADDIDEADAYLVSRVRDKVGPAIPIVVTFDLHANLSAAIVDAADVLIGYDTLPHVDMGDRGREAAHVIARLIAENKRPSKAFRKLPLITPPQMQSTHESPMREIMALREEIERGPGVLTASVVAGFPYCDIPHLGMAVVVYGEAQIVGPAADRLAEAVWSRRDQFKPALVSPEEAVRFAVSANRGPIFLVEPADNIGGGAPGDGTYLLKALIEAKAAGAAVVIWDPEAAAEACRIGLGGRFKGDVGGKTLALHGPPVGVEGRISFAGPVRYKRDAAWMNGQPTDLGLCAAIEMGGVKVIVTTERAIPFDTMHLRIPGAMPEATKTMTLKCAVAWSGAFGAMAQGQVYVDTPGVCSSNLERMPYTRLTHKLYPLARDVEWRAGG